MRTLLCLVVPMMMLGCAHSKIPNTQIADTEENREIVGLVGDYTSAMENLDADAVLSLVSPRYFEDNGNSDKSDDYDFRELKEKLADEFKRTKKIQLEMKINEVLVEEKNAYAYIYYTYRSQTKFATGTKWNTDSDHSRIVFERHKGRWLMVSGI
jgi:ketosteroid isomerase-like protein